MFYVPSILAGFILGFVCALVCTYVQNVMRRTLLASVEHYRPLRRIAEALRINDTQILEVPSVSVYGDLTVHEGWMVVYYEQYNPETFDIENAHPAYINLNGSNLRISYTREKVLKKAHWNELPYKKKFYHYEDFDISNCDVKLLPLGLSRGRRWLRKYPIYIALNDSTLEPEGQSFAYPSTIFGRPADGGYTHSDFQQETRLDSFLLGPKEVPTVETPLYLFGRTNRQKEDWFRRLVAAAKLDPKDRAESSNELNMRKLLTQKLDTRNIDKMQRRGKFIKYVYPTLLEPHPSQFLTLMSDYNLQVITNAGVCLLKPLMSHYNRPGARDRIEIEIQNARNARVAPNLLWFNAFMARILADVAENPKLKEHLYRAAQKKVSSIGLPSFVEDITVTDMYLGDTIPKIHCTSNPMLDQRGIWVNADVTYTGNAYLVLETRLNLLNAECDIQEGEFVLPNVRTKKPIGFQPSEDRPKEDKDSISEGNNSAGEPFAAHEDMANNSPANSKRKRKKVKNKFLRCMSTIVQSKAFKCATRHSCLKHTIEEWSSRRFVLNAELKGFAGTITFNIPPPPADRIWFGFQNCPYLNIKANPTMGSKPVERLKNFVKNGLIKLVRKRLILPNMGEIVIPPMNGNLPE